MTYPRALFRIVALDPSIFVELDKKGSLFFTAFLNVLALGLLFGYTNVLLNPELTQGFVNPKMALLATALLVLIGVAHIFFAHAGFSLLLWAIAKGLRGMAPFFSVYLYTGAAVVPLWLGLPMLSLKFSGTAGAFALISGLTGLAWSFFTLSRSVMSSQNFSFARSATTLALTALFIISFLVLLR